MKKFKLIAIMLIIAAMLPSCGSNDTSSDSGNNSSQVQLAEGEEKINVKCTVETSEAEIIYAGHEEKMISPDIGFYTSYQRWLDASKDCTWETVKDVKGNYDEDFFKSHSLYFYTHSASAGMKYKLKKATLNKSSGKNVLTLYTSCDTKGTVDSLGVYVFYIETDKNIDVIDEVVLKE